MGLFCTDTVNFFCFAKVFAITALIFTDAKVPNAFQVNFISTRTNGIKKGLNC